MAKDSKYKIAVVSALVGAAVGSVMTFFMPLLYQRVVDGPKPIDQSPRQILDWFNSFDNRAAALMTAQDLYIGKYVNETGVVSRIGRSSNSPQAIVFVGSVVCFLDYSDAAGLSEGETVTVVGRIAAIKGGESGLQLHDCRFRSIGPPGESDLP